MQKSAIAKWLACFGTIAVVVAIVQLSAGAQTPPPPAPGRDSSASETPASSAATPLQTAPRQALSPVDARAASPTPEAQSAGEKAIRGVVDTFVKDYNAGDSKGIASLFIPDAEIIAEDGTAHQGRDAIETEFADIFKNHPKATIKDDIESIRFVSPYVAIEEGTSTVVHDPDTLPERSRYEAVHVRQGGHWLMASARDLPDEQASGEEQLQQLHWLIGDWVDESSDSTVHTSYRWSDDHHYILSDFSADIEGHLSIKGTQRIGWDPLNKTIRAWAFDSEGGFTEAIWTRAGDQWTIKTTGVTAEGKAASSTNYLTHLHKHRMSWESRDRLVGGEKTPDLGPITIVRQAPAPGVPGPGSQSAK